MRLPGRPCALPSTRFVGRPPGALGPCALALPPQPGERPRALDFEGALAAEDDRLARRPQRPPPPPLLVRYPRPVRGAGARAGRRAVGDRLLVLLNDDLLQDPAERSTVSRPSSVWRPGNPTTSVLLRVPGAIAGINPATRRRLQERFAAPNRELARLLGRDLSAVGGPPGRRPRTARLPRNGAAFRRRSRAAPASLRPVRRGSGGQRFECRTGGRLAMTQTEARRSIAADSCKPGSWGARSSPPTRCSLVGPQPCRATQPWARWTPTGCSSPGVHLADRGPVECPCLRNEVQVAPRPGRRTGLRGAGRLGVRLELRAGKWRRWGRHAPVQPVAGPSPTPVASSTAPTGTAAAGTPPGGRGCPARRRTTVACGRSIRSGAGPRSPISAWAASTTRVPPSTPRTGRCT